MKTKELKNESTSRLFEKLLEVMDQLRGPNGCPWDKKQTHQSLTPHLLEETYEVLATIEEQDHSHLPEELGDLLLQIIFHAQIGKEAGNFGISDVISQLIHKLVRRHPHVFGEEKVEHPEEALRRWEKIKAAEKQDTESVLESIPTQLPALARAYRIGSKVARLGFDWKQPANVIEKINEEIQELQQEISSESQDNIEAEFGDLLFTLAQLARFLKVNPEDALRKSTNKFQKRFQWMEQKIREKNQSMEDYQKEALEELWKEAKSSTKNVD